MGCSPSKGKFLLKPNSFGEQEALVDESSQDSVDSGPAMVEDTCLNFQKKEKETPLYSDKNCSQETLMARQDSRPMFPQNTINNQEVRVNEMPQEIIGDALQEHMVQRVEIQKKNMRRRSTDRHRKSSSIQTKADFLPHMVRAHQAAYGFLNPNITKYETLLGLLDQATQTQLSLQPIMAALVLYFEEINQALEEMAEEGELMLKEYGESMSLPSGMVSQALWSDKPSNTLADLVDPPPDLLQQLLQQSSEKMKRVGGSVKNLGDTALDEVIEYFSCLSKLFAEKLQTKQAAELRLSQVLARIEMSAIKTSNPKDSALPSEDSGIGGESESLAGSERHQCHRGSAGSGSCKSIVDVWGVFGHYHNDLAKFVTYNKDDEEEEEGNADKYGDDDDDDDDDHDDDDDDDDDDRCERRRSRSSPPDPSNALCYMCANDVKNQQPTFKKRFTESCNVHCKAENDSSSSCANVLIELQRSQRELDIKMKKISEMQQPKDSTWSQPGLRRHSLNASVDFHKSRGRRKKPPCSLTPSQLPLIQSVKCHSYSQAFSQGMDGLNKKGSVYNIGYSKGEDTGNASRSCTDCRDDLEIDNLPPPPPEVLLDNSFKYHEGQLQTEKLCGDPGLSLPLIHPQTQRRKKVMQKMEVLPSKVNVKLKSIAASPAPPIKKNGPTEIPQLQKENLEKPEETKVLYKQARKIIHICNAGESTDTKNTPTGDLTALQVTNGQSCDRKKMLESEMASVKLPVIAPPVSRVRLTQACHSVYHSFARPPMFRPYSNSRSSSPTTATCVNNNNTEQIVPSLSFHEARSVFCKNELQSPQTTQPPGSAVLPRKCGEIQRGRLCTRGRDNPTSRTQSEQRPGMTSYSEYERAGHLLSQHTQKDEPSIEK